MRPIIGIVARCEENENGTSMLYVFESVRQSIINCGGEPLLLLPPQDLDYYKTRIKDYPEFTDDEEKRMLKWLDMCDGILLPGGYKLTNFDRYVVEYATKKDIPLLGICLGMQVLSCYKEEIDIVPIDENHLNHKQESQDGVSHRVDIKKDNLLYDILKKDNIMVNSFHTKQVTPNKYYEIIAYSEDGIIEAIQNKNNTFNLGVQWHPEKNYLTDVNSKKIMDALIEYSKNKIKINN
ncbi:MAG: gamma-glutamyl-gamma-aminobutyrate hydrolase family protein [Bacilli bacterium]|nr:gamma-glutamyl-gamma-aminobutyrate hydrolase family protein [Bacilli bacterium]